jgi:hypothetical protein
MRKLLKYGAIGLLAIAVFGAIFSGAWVKAEPLFGRTIKECEDPDKPVTAECFIEDFYTWSVPIGLGLAVLMIILGGYKYMTSQGNAEALGEAKEIIYSAIAGLVLLLLIALIYNALISAPPT